MTLKVQHAYTEIMKHHATVTEQDAHKLVDAAKKDNKKASGFFAGEKTPGTDWLKDAYQKHSKHFKDFGAKAVILPVIGLTPEGHVQN